VDGAFDLAGAVLDAGEGVGDSQAQIVVAMGGEDDVFGADGGELPDQVGEDFAVAVGRGVADGVREIDCGGAGFDSGVDDFFQEIQLGAAGVFGGEFDVGGVFQRL